MLEQAVKKFMAAGDQELLRHSPRQAALYTGLVLEEVAELLRTLSANNALPVTHGIKEVALMASDLSLMADEFKKGTHDIMLEAPDRIGMLDDAVDIAWVAAGLGFSIGADYEGAVQEVAASNMSKCNPDTGKMNKHPITGKILKGRDFFEPGLAQFVRVCESEGGEID